jgi:hypothetical protein
MAEQTQGKAIEMEIERLSNAMGTTPEALKGELARLQEENGINLMTALSRYKLDNDFLLRRINGVYRIWPLDISDMKTRNTKDGEKTLIDVVGVFFGPTSRTSGAVPFMHKMSLWEDDIEKAKPLQGEAGPFMFKGSLDARNNRLFINRGAEFQKDTTNKAPKLDELMTKIVEQAVPLSKLMDQNAKEQFIYEDQDIITTGEVADIRATEDGRPIISLTDMGANIVTVWPPNGFEANMSMKNTRVLVFGWHKIKDASTISADVIVAV